MQVLLDTSYVYQLIASPTRLSAAERAFLSDPEGKSFVGAVSIWELRPKSATRRRVSGRGFNLRFPIEACVRILEGLGFAFIPPTARHAARPLDTPLRHRDPFDELLLVQAQVEDLRLLTVDRLLVDHPLAITA